MRLRSPYSAALLILVAACSDRGPAATALSQDETVVANAEVGGFSYEIMVCQRTKPVPSTPPGYAATWTETVEMIEAADQKDADFSRFMRDQAMQLRHDYYEHFEERESFETYSQAGSMDVTGDVLSASPDLVSVSVGTAFYIAGMAHPQSEGGRALNWSRRLHRPLTQGDVFATPPDRALRRVALAQFDNRDNLQNPDDPDGIPLTWERASIGSDGISWSFDSYELGGYLSGGSATVGWPVLKPYLRDDLPFVIGAIREASYTVRKEQMSAECGYPA